MVFFASSPHFFIQSWKRPPTHKTRWQTFHISFRKATAECWLASKLLYDNGDSIQHTHWRWISGTLHDVSVCLDWLWNTYQSKKAYIQYWVYVGCLQRLKSIFSSLESMVLDDYSLFWASKYHIPLTDEISMLKQAANTENQNMCWYGIYLIIVLGYYETRVIYSRYDGVVIVCIIGTTSAEDAVSNSPCWKSLLDEEI